MFNVWLIDEIKFTFCNIIRTLGIFTVINRVSSFMLQNFYDTETWISHKILQMQCMLII